MKKLLTILALLPLAGFVSNAGVEQDYIERYAPMAVSEMHRTGIPASITLAQGLLESGAGQSTLALYANNHFGIKCHNKWTGDTFYKDDDTANECFRSYEKAEDSFLDHSEFLRSGSRYAALFDLGPADYESWAKGLKAAGYATDPKYPAKLINLIEEFQLYRYDAMDSDSFSGDGTVDLAEEAFASVGQQEDAAAGLQGTEDVVLVNNVLKVTESLSFPVRRTVFEENGRRYVISRTGETYASIAGLYSLWVKEILRFNGLKAEPEGELEPGSVVYLSRRTRSRNE